MKALTVRQPWAHAILHLGKDVENRSWPTRYRGPLLIHAGLRVEPIQLGVALPLPTGAVLGVVELVACVRDAPSQWAMPNCWHWILRNPRALKRPIPWSGRLGLFEIPIAEDSLRFSPIACGSGVLKDGIRTTAHPPRRR
jgi:hypothetical protein